MWENYRKEYFFNGLKWVQGSLQDKKYQTVLMSFLIGKGLKTEKWKVERVFWVKSFFKPYRVEFRRLINFNVILLLWKE